MEYTWRRHGGYEVSSLGDKRFSALSCKLQDGRTIEQHYQCDIKGYNIGGTNWRLGKGKPPLYYITENALRDKYVELWREYLRLNPKLLEKLRRNVKQRKGILSNRFATTPINQASALAQILKETEPVIYFNEHAIRHISEIQNAYLYMEDDK